jgi:acyl carrier protein
MSIAEYLKSFVLDVSDVDEGDISDAASFEDLGLDSLAFVEMRIGLAKKFGVKIDPALFESGEISTLGQTVAYVQRLVGAQAVPELSKAPD